MKLIINENEIVQLIHHQIENFWGEIGKRQLNGDLRIEISKTLQRVEKCFSKVHTKGIWENGESVFSPFHTTSWTIFLYYLSNELLKRDKNAADMIYYLNKVLHAVDWYHEIMLPDYFFAEHPLCSVLGRAKYSNYLLIYQGTTIGGSSELYFIRFLEKMLFFMLGVPYLAIVILEVMLYYQLIHVLKMKIYHQTA